MFKLRVPIALMGMAASLAIPFSAPSASASAHAAVAAVKVNSPNGFSAECAKPNAERVGPWVCPAPESVVRAQAKKDLASDGVISPSATAYCDVGASCWTYADTAHMSYTGVGYYGVGDTDQLGEIHVHWGDVWSGQNFKTNTFYMYSTNFINSANMSGDLLYISGAYPQGKRVNPSQFKQTTPKNAGSLAKISWPSNGYTARSTSVAHAIVAHQFNWHVDGHEGRWYWYVKNYIADRQSSGSYYFTQDLPNDPEQAGWSSS